MGGLGEIFRTLWLVLPPWAFALLVATLLIPVVRGYTFRTRGRQISEAVRRLVRAEAHEREALVRRAFERAGDHPALLAQLVRDAEKRHMPVLAGQARARLGEVPGGRAELALLQEPDRAAGMHPLEVVVRVEQLLDEGLVEAARLRLEEALARHPDHAELLALKERVTGASPPAP